MTGSSNFILVACFLVLLVLMLLLRPWQLRSLPAEQRMLPTWFVLPALALLLALAGATAYLGLLPQGQPEAVAVAEVPGASPPASLAEGKAGDPERMVQSLAQKLQANPDDGPGWVKLAHSLKVLGRYPESEQAFAKAGKELANDPDLLTEYADVMAMQNGGKLVGKSLELLKQALALSPHHTTALWMSGTAAYQRQDYAQAKAEWQKLLVILPPDSQDRTVIQANLEEIRGLMGEGGAVPLALASGHPVTPGATAAAPLPGVGAHKASAGAATIRGRVQLAPELAAKLAPGDALFVFARAPSGSPMPLAVLRAQGSDLPLDFVLDSSNAMNPDLTLEKAGVVNIEVRLSKHGDVALKSGDLFGQRAGVRVGARDVLVVINQQK